MMIDKEAAAYCAVFSSNGYNGTRVSYTCQAVSAALEREGLQCDVTVPYISIPPPAPHYRAVFPATWGRLGRFLERKAPNMTARAQEAQFLRHILSVRTNKKIAYIWPDASYDLINNLRSSHVFVAREMTNCHRATAKRILDEVYADIGATSDHGITDASIEEEIRCLSAVDLVFAPNEKVAESLLENGVSSNRIWPTSYGFDPDRISFRANEKSNPEILNALFVGQLCFRKGAHILIKAWLNSGVQGTLTLVGAADPELLAMAGDSIDGRRVIWKSFTHQISEEYQNADVFAFPSFEEGGPLVAYEAAACGLPIIATEMGGGRILQDGVTGFVVPPGSQEALEQAFLAAATDRSNLRKLGATAKDLSINYTWRGAAKTRLNGLRALIDGQP